MDLHESAKKNKRIARSRGRRTQSRKKIGNESDGNINILSMTKKNDREFTGVANLCPPAGKKAYF